jgi:hypothetical protein
MRFLWSVFKRTHYCRPCRKWFTLKREAETYRESGRSYTRIIKRCRRCDHVPSWYDPFPEEGGIERAATVSN